MNKKIGVTGAKGYIGRSLMLQPNMVAIEGDILDTKQIEMEIESKRPDLIVHLAAITDTDECERIANEMKVKATNVTATFDLANTCEKHGIGMVFLSTFQVFNGKKWVGQTYTEKDKPDPVNFYGLSKLTAEAYQTVYPGMKIVRAPYVFDWGRLAERIDVLQQRDAYYPTFLKRSFMHLNHFIDNLVYYIENFESMPPILHISTDDTVSWWQFMTCVSDALMLEHVALPRSKEEGFLTPKPHKAGLNPTLSHSYNFPHYSFVDGIELLRVGL